MRNFLREYFSFSDRERNGVVVLLVAITVLVLVLKLERQFISLPREDFSKFDRFIAAAENQQRKDSAAEKDEQFKTQNGIPPVAQEVGQHSLMLQKQLFYFNPNENSMDDWMRLGLSAGQARVVKNYTSKGGKFRTKNDVKKLFVVSADLYSEWEPYIVLPGKTDSAAQHPGATFHTAPRIVELNTADSAALISVSGIGPVFAHRILSYRDRLGGFHSTAQLLEIFGMDTDRYAQIRNFLSADSSLIHRININTAEVNELKKHPYFSWNVANALVNFRKSHGLFTTIADTRKCNLVSDDLYRKIAPYLTL